MDQEPDEQSHLDQADIPRCCCGRPDCAFLAHTCNLLDKVKRDARTAGELGQVCAAASLIYNPLATVNTRRPVERLPP